MPKNDRDHHVVLFVSLPQVATWRYQRGSRSLAINLTQPSTPAAKEIAADVKNDNESGDGDDYDIPEQTEDVIEQLLTGGFSHFSKMNR